MTKCDKTSDTVFDTLPCSSSSSSSSSSRHFCKIQDKDESFYRQFNIVVCGLDSIGARRWINGLLLGLVEYDGEGAVKPQTIIPMVDGGTEGTHTQNHVRFFLC